MPTGKKSSLDILSLMRNGNIQEASRRVVGQEAIKAFTVLRNQIDQISRLFEAKVADSITQIQSRSESIDSQKQAIRDAGFLLMERMKNGSVAFEALTKHTDQRVFNFRAISFTGILFLLLIGYMIARSILVPIHQAVEFAQIMGQGDLSRRLNLKTQDELGELSRTLDSMADGLEAKGKIAESIADGDLTRRVSLLSEKDTLGIAFTQMAENLKELLSTISSVSDAVAAGSEQLSHASDDLARGATDQAASVEEISASMTEIGAQAKANAQNARKASDTARSVRNMGEAGSDQMKDMLTSMDNINTSSQEIAKIIKVIDEIAFQTNLLALNAAVEAARAGQHGKGFAVVAEEVRNLASRSTRAAKETSELIENSLKTVSEGAQAVDKTSESLSQIIDGTRELATLVEDISSASSEQERGVEQINQALSQVDDVTQRMSAGTEEMSSASRTLNDQALDLQRLMDKFEVQESTARSKRGLPLISSLPNGGGMNQASL